MSGTLEGRTAPDNLAARLLCAAGLTSVAIVDDQTLWSRFACGCLRFGFA